MRLTVRIHFLRGLSRALPIILFTICLALASSPTASLAQSLDGSPPDQPVKLVFIHHSTGENWLKDEDGGLGRALAENNYFVSDTNYGWGPDYIGDRTDIVNWQEWFLGENSPAILQALYSEGGQLSNYTRTFDDPGGENQVILFKSCFPNSNLEGSPDDPAEQGDGLTVGNAKYIYNSLLEYFRTRPDKLFVVITAPPVADPTYAANARAFNDWLVFEWLQDNDYQAGNVAVFDFYNLLTGADNHHRLSEGEVEHINYGEGDTAFYPSQDGDDHPSQAGNLKATQEFVPLLNVYYRTWAAGNPAVEAVQSAYEPDEPAPAEPPPAEEAPSESPGTAPFGSLIDDFEGDSPPDTEGWQSYRDEANPTSITCAPVAGEAASGNAALQVDFDIAANSWASCGLYYATPQDWSAATGLSFALHASQPALVFNIDVYAGSSDEQQTYLFTLETPGDAADGWQTIEIPWEYLLRADWEADAGTPLSELGNIVGVGFGFNTYPDTPNTGTIWIDDLQLSGTGQPAEQPEQPAGQSEQPVEEPAAAEPETAAEPEQAEGGGGLCKSVYLLPAAIGLLALSRRRKRA